MTWNFCSPGMRENELLLCYVSSCGHCDSSVGDTCTLCRHQVPLQGQELQASDRSPGLLDSMSSQGTSLEGRGRESHRSHADPGHPGGWRLIQLRAVSPGLSGLPGPITSRGSALSTRAICGQWSELGGSANPEQRLRTATLARPCGEGPRAPEPTPRLSQAKLAAEVNLP